MGLAVSPYNSTKMALIAKEICQGDRNKEGVGADGKELNPFQWARIQLNLPGTKNYDLGKSWIPKMRSNGRVACDIFSFLDDE
jgi:hypothetical protein